MAQCPQCGLDKAEFRREYTHGEYVTVLFCSNCGYTYRDNTAIEKEIANVAEFKEQMSSVNYYMDILNTPLKNTEVFSLKHIIGICIILGLGIPTLLININLIPYIELIRLRLSDLIYLIIGAFSILIGIIFILVGKKEAKMLLNDNIAFNNDLLAKKELAKIAVEEAYEKSNKCLPLKYANPYIVSKIESYLQNKQASNITEAITKYDRQNFISTDLSWSKLFDI